MRPGEFCEVDDAFCFKRKNESFYFPVIFSRTSEIEIKGEEASSSLEERAMTRKNASWSSREWHSKRNWQRSPFDAGAQSSQDKWRKPAPRTYWKEVSHTEDELGFFGKRQEGYLGQKLKRK